LVVLLLLLFLAVVMFLFLLVFVGCCFASAEQRSTCLFLVPVAISVLFLWRKLIAALAYGMKGSKQGSTC
jgi:hypothetical protein